MRAVKCTVCSRTPLIRVGWDGEASRYAENQGDCDFSLKIGYIVSLKFGCYYTGLLKMIVGGFNNLSYTINLR